MTDVKVLRKTRATAALAAVFVVLLIVATFARAERSIEFDEQRFFRLQNDMDLFTREYLGCPASGYPPAIECVRGRGVFDAKLHERIIEETGKYADRYK